MRFAIGNSKWAGLLAATFSIGAALLLGGQGRAPRIPFVIATGPTAGTYFPVGEAIASIVSHPPGVSRCEERGVCGPPGLIASVRTSPGAVSNVLAVNAHTVDAALAQSDVVAEAARGRGAFKGAGAQKHVRVLADLFPEEVHLIAARSAHIKSVAGLRHKRVSLGPKESGTAVTAKSILAAYGVPYWRLRIDNDPADLAAEKLSRGKIDAMFFVGGAPVSLVRELLASGRATLLSIDGKGRKRLLKSDRSLMAGAIPAGLYPNTGKVATVSVRSILIVNEFVPSPVVYGVTRSLFNAVNRDKLAGSNRSAQFIRLDSAIADLPVQIHPGAAQFYREVGELPNKPSAKKPAAKPDKA